MRVKVTQRQFELLLNNLDYIGGASLVMSDKTFRKIIPDGYPMNEQRKLHEQKLFKVDMWLGSFSTKALIFANDGGVAIALAKKMYPRATVYGAKQVKGKLC